VSKDDSFNLTKQLKKAKVIIRCHFSIWIVKAWTT